MASAIEPPSTEPPDAAEDDGQLGAGDEGDGNWTSPKAELVLSRPAYWIGGTVVGTVRLISPTFVHSEDEGARYDGGGGGPADGDDGGGEVRVGEAAGGGGSHREGEETPSADVNDGRDVPPPPPLPAASVLAAAPPALTPKVFSPAPPHPRSVFTSARLYLAGRCRIDPRWHDARSLAALYGTHPLLSTLDTDVEPAAVDAYFGERRDGVHIEGGTTVCFWATDVVDLLELDERGEEGSWERLRPKPLGLGVTERTSGAWASEMAATADSATADAAGGEEGGTGEEERNEGGSGGGEDPDVCAEMVGYPRMGKLDERQMAFSFRADLPTDIPPSAKAACARYFYSAVVCAKTRRGETIIMQAPFEVVSSRSSNLSRAPRPEVVQSAGRVKIGTCAAVAHSNGLPCYLSSTDMIRAAKISVDRSFGLCSRTTASDVRSLRVTDPAGTPCCVLTLVGTSVMTPGGKAMVHFDFGEELLLAPESDGGVTTVLACYQVAASLQGEEVSCYDDGSRKKTRTYMFDSAYSAVETGYTDSLSLSLVLPLDCPCTLRTDLVEIRIVCKIEITVDRQGGGGYDVLRLELPCNVVHDAAGDNGDARADEDDMPHSIAGIMPWEREEGRKEQSGEWHAGDIMQDLRMLSLHMLDAMS